jgi:hypothetical protein
MHFCPSFFFNSHPSPPVENLFWLLLSQAFDGAVFWFLVGRRGEEPAKGNESSRYQSLMTNDASDGIMSHAFLVIRNGILATTQLAT